MTVQLNPKWMSILPEFVRRRIEGRQDLQNVLGNTGWLFFDNILRMGVGLIVGVWVARYLGPEQFGDYNYAIAFVSMFSSVASLGVDGIVVRELVKQPQHAAEILGSAFILKLFGGILTVILATSAVYYLRPADNSMFWYVVLISAGTIFQAFNTITLWFQSKVQSKYSVYARNISFVIVTFIKIYLLVNRFSLIWFVSITLLELIITAILLSWIYTVKGFKLFNWRVSYNRCDSLLKNSWPLILTGLAIYVQARVDQVMLGEMIGSAEVGQYSAAMRLIEVFGFIPMAIVSSVSPSIIAAKSVSNELYYDKLLNLYRIMFILFLVTALPIFIFSENIIVLIYGESYRQAGVLLSLFAIRLFFTNYGVAKSLFITNENLFRYALVTTTIAMIINVLLNYLLIPLYQSRGSITAMIISFAFSTFIADLFFKEVKPNLYIMFKSMISPLKLRCYHDKEK